MPILAALLVSCFTGIAEVFARYVSRRVAAAVAGVALMAALTGALFTALSLLVAGLVTALPTGHGVATGLWLAIPDNGPAVVAACIACDVAISVYRLNVANVLFSIPSA